MELWFGLHHLLLLFVEYLQETVPFILDAVRVLPAFRQFHALALQVLLTLAKVRDCFTPLDLVVFERLNGSQELDGLHCISRVHRESFELAASIVHTLEPAISSSHHRFGKLHEKIFDPYIVLFHHACLHVRVVNCDSTASPLIAEVQVVAAFAHANQHRDPLAKIVIVHV